MPREDGMTAMDPRQPLVLIVEDFADAREMYAAFLSLSGLQVLEAARGEEAVRMAVDARPDAIVMDLALPGIDGWEATRRLKADPRTARIPVIALSGQVLPRHADEARRAGCAVVLLKPVLPEALVAEVRRILERGSFPPSGDARGVS